MEIKEGDVIRRVSDGVEFTINKLSDEWALIGSPNGSKTLTGISNINTKLFFEKQEDTNE